jgi:hypothetical protein
MEMDDKRSALDNKKKRIPKEYVNDFRTGKTTVLEKTFDTISTSSTLFPLPYHE